MVLVDIFIWLTLLVPQLFFNLGFLRVLRLWTLIHSEFFWRTVARRIDDTRWEETVKAVANLVTFVFVATAVQNWGGTDNGWGALGSHI